MKLSMITIMSLSLLCVNAYAADESYTTQPATGANIQMESSDSKNKMNGDKFLAENKMKKGVVTLPDGLQYKVITEGNGPKPTKDDVVTVHYTGTLIDGTVFDSSYKHGQPVSFPVSGVIRGWTEALQLMKVGSTWELYIPSDLAYGDRGAPPVIGPNETLIFKVQLLDIQKG